MSDVVELLHEQLTLEQPTRKHLQDQLLREKLRTIEVGRHGLGGERRQVGDRADGYGAPMEGTGGSASRKDSLAYCVGRGLTAAGFVTRSVCVATMSTFVCSELEV